MREGSFQIRVEMVCGGASSHADQVTVLRIRSALMEFLLTGFKSLIACSVCQNGDSPFCLFVTDSVLDERLETVLLACRGRAVNVTSI